MIDISQKKITQRLACAEGCIRFTPKVFRILLKQGSPKGDIWQTAKVAGIMSAKNTPSIVPFCHPLMLEKVQITFDVLKSKNTIKIKAEVLSSGKTGVEMEALSAVSAACLTIYDMMKWAGLGMIISDIHLVHKSGGKSGEYNYKRYLKRGAKQPLE